MSKPVLVQVAEENCRLLEERAARIITLEQERDELQSLIDKFDQEMEKGLPRGDQASGHRQVHMSVACFDAYIALRQRAKKKK